MPSPTATPTTATPTAERILTAARTLFNERGYAGVTLTEIAASIGISQGNLTYHFPTKQQLADRLRDQSRQQSQARRASLTAGDVVDDYLEHLRFAMEITWNNRFLLLDTHLRDSAGTGTGGPPEMAADLVELGGLVDRLIEEGLVRTPDHVDVERLTRGLWIVSRYWMDHLREMEGRREISWQDQLEGIQQHLTMLLPHLTATGRRRFERAMAQAATPSNPYEE